MPPPPLLMGTQSQQTFSQSWPPPGLILDLQHSLAMMLFPRNNNASSGPPPDPCSQLRGQTPPSPSVPKNPLVSRSGLASPPKVLKAWPNQTEPVAKMHPYKHPQISTPRNTTDRYSHHRMSMRITKWLQHTNVFLSRNSYP